jgi:PHD/YefM family antitoxin component YafN of YafNO toxin-antitoxin module
MMEIPTQEAATRLAQIVADISTDHSRLVLRGDDGAVAVVLSAEEFADLEDLASVADYYLRKESAERQPS